MGGIQGAAGNYVNFAGYPVYRGPDGSSLYQQGALSVPVTTGTFNTPSGNNTGVYGETLSFSLTYSGTVRVGFAVDSVASATYAPDYVGIYSNATGTVFSSLLVRNGAPDMAIFDIVNPAGQTFTVAPVAVGEQPGQRLGDELGDIRPYPGAGAVNRRSAGCRWCRVWNRRQASAIAPVLAGPL